MSAKSYKLRVGDVRKLKLLSKKSWKKIAAECDRDYGTVMRWLKGESLLIDSAIALANSLNTTMERIILQEDGSSGSVTKIDVTIRTDKSHQELIAFLKQLKILYDDIYYVPELSSKEFVTVKMTPMDQVSLLSFLVNSKIIHDSIKGIVPPKQNRKAYDDIFPGLTPSD